MSSLNPALRVGRQLGEVAEVHDGLPRARRGERAVDRLRAVRIASAGGARAPVPARVLRRHAPARGHRDGPDDRPEADRSRTSRRPRSTSPCSSRSSGCSATCDRGARRGGDLHLARRRGRVAALQPRARDVRGPHRRGARRRDARRRRPRTRTRRRSSRPSPTMESDRARPLATIPGRAPGPFDPSPGCPSRTRCPRASTAAARSCRRSSRARARPSRRVLASRSRATSPGRASRSRAAAGRARVTALEARGVTVRFGHGDSGG